ncbi:ABC transporter substrate-binding protein [Thalassospira sp. TSL5-1]|uniref:substrate-binding periplasmic protein n=1 Tax=Thalassospira sp. TSL5-1 TaxID=1544451 RepID=UPI00143A963B|nr:ABC transporter substrate-binding protein [Thalassospira sp. TSL5-1]
MFFDAMARKLFEDAGLSFIEQPQQPWKRAYQETIYGPRHVIYPTTRTEEREDKLKWVGPISRTFWNLYSRKNSVWAGRKIADIFKSARIGVTLGSAREHYLRKRGAKNVVAVARDDQLFAMLNANRIDVLAMGFASIDFLTNDLKQPDIDIGLLTSYRVCYLYFALSKDSPNTDVMDLQNSLERFYQDGRFLAMRRKFDLNADPENYFIKAITDPKNRNVGCKDID